MAIRYSGNVEMIIAADPHANYTYTVRFYVDGVRVAIAREVGMAPADRRRLAEDSPEAYDLIARAAAGFERVGERDEGDGVEDAGGWYDEDPAGDVVVRRRMKPAGAAGTGKAKKATDRKPAKFSKPSGYSLPPRGHTDDFQVRARFMWEHAGYVQGRRAEGAAALALAEMWLDCAEDEDLAARIEEDEDYPPDFDDEGVTAQITDGNLDWLRLAIQTRPLGGKKARVLASLGGVTATRDKVGRDYKRVVYAELALEALNEIITLVQKA